MRSDPRNADVEVAGASGALPSAPRGNSVFPARKRPDHPVEPPRANKLAAIVEMVEAAEIEPASVFTREERWRADVAVRPRLPLTSSPTERTCAARRTVWEIAPPRDGIEVGLWR